MEIKTGTLGIKVEKSYAEGFKKMFGRDVEIGSKTEVDYVCNEEEKTITIQGESEYVIKYDVKIEDVEGVPGLHKYVVDYTIEGLEEEVVGSYELYATTHPTFTMVRKLFYILLAKFRPSIVRRGARKTEEQVRAGKLAKLIAKYLNKGKSLDEARDMAEAELEEKESQEQQEIEQPEYEEVEEDDDIEVIEDDGISQEF